MTANTTQIGPATAPVQPGLRDEPLHLGAELRTAVTVASRELMRLTRARSRLFSSLIQSLMFLCVLGHGLNRLVTTGAGTGTGIDNSFVQFMLPGVIAMTLVTTAMTSGFSIVWDREFGAPARDARRATEPSRARYREGRRGASVAASQATLLLLLAPLVGLTLAPLLLLRMIGIQILAALALTALAVMIASRIRQMESFQVLTQLVLSPLIFLSGALFPLHDLLPWLAILTRLNPLSYIVDPLRRTLLSNPPSGSGFLDRTSPGLDIFGQTLPVALELLAVAAMALIILAAAVRGFSRRDRPRRSLGAASADGGACVRRVVRARSCV